MTAPALPLRTDRLVLRTAEPTDLDAFLTYWGDAEVCQYLPFGPFDRAGALKRLGRFFQCVDAVASGDCLLLVVEHEGAVVGDVMLRLKAGDPPAVAEVGWVFHPSSQGKGFATEAAKALVDLAFDHYGCHRVEAQLDPRNTASVKLCLRLGMQEEAHLRRDFQFPGTDEWGDTGIYGLLRDDS